MKIGKASNPTADFCTDRDKRSIKYIRFNVFGTPEVFS